MTNIIRFGIISNIPYFKIKVGKTKVPIKYLCANKKLFKYFLTILPYFYVYGDKKQFVKFLRDYNDILLPASNRVYLGKIAIGRPDLNIKLLKLVSQKLNRSS